MKRRIYAKKSLGQHYLRDKNIKNRIIKSLDLNQDGLCTIGSEPAGITKENGSYYFDITPEYQAHANYASANIVVYDGVDIDTKKNFIGKLSAPFDATITSFNVTPITTMIVALKNELGDLVGRAQVVDPSTLAHERISFGSRVTLIDGDTDEEVIYTIVGSQESNPDRGLISIQSPLARQLMGKEEGDEVSMQLPSGKKKYDIEEVSYQDIDIQR